MKKLHILSQVFFEKILFGFCNPFYFGTNFKNRTHFLVVFGNQLLITDHCNYFSQLIYLWQDWLLNSVCIVRSLRLWKFLLLLKIVSNWYLNRNFRIVNEKKIRGIAQKCSFFSKLPKLQKLENYTVTKNEHLQSNEKKIKKIKKNNIVSSW